MPGATEEPTDQRIDVDGLAFRVLSSRRGVSNSPAFVLIHGIGMSHRYLARLHRELAEVADVHSIDLPGFGGLPRPARSLSVADMAAALSTVFARMGLRGTVLIGHSMGAQWAVELAAQEPEAAASVILIGPVADDRHRTIRAQSVALALDTVGEPLNGNALVFTDYLRCGPRWYLAQAREMVSYPIEERIAAILAPVLIIRGSDDPIAGTSWSRRLRDRARDGALVVVPGRRHLAQFSAPRAVASAVSSFVSGVSARI